MKPGNSKPSVRGILQVGDQGMHLADCISRQRRAANVEMESDRLGDAFTGGQRRRLIDLDKRHWWPLARGCSAGAHCACASKCADDGDDQGNRDCDGDCDAHDPCDQGV